MSRSTTAAKSLSTAATLFAGPGRASNSTPSVNGSASFHFIIDGNIQTLSAQNAPNEGPIKGLLFVPNLDNHDPCNNITAPFIPENVTRHQDVAPFSYRTIGLAPWISPNCSQSFLDASRRVGTEALVFFLPGTDDSKPPPPADSTWLLSGGTSWESESIYPVYAVPGPAGNALMEQLSWYSGREEHPQHQQNASTSSTTIPRDMRLFTLIDLDKSGGKAPSLWGFLLAILGTILVLCIGLVVLYQFLQRRRRETLQRRLEAGRSSSLQYDLQHFRVPRELLTKLPTFVYPDISDVDKDSSCHERDSDELNAAENAPLEAEQVDPEKESDTELGTQTTGRDEPSGYTKETPEHDAKTANATIENFPSQQALQESLSQPMSLARHPQPKHLNRLSHSQTTCAICLDDFVPASSVVRELPCGHIYHPECIDVSLTQTSSLCPLCKKCVLEPEFFISAPEAVFQRYSFREV
ncbi:hypothetical protein BDV18DRAFT_120827 [Aspergillus unguis]